MLTYLFFLIFIGIAVGLSWFLIFSDRGEHEPVSALWLALGFGVLAAVPTIFLEKYLLHINGALPSDLHKLAWTTLGVGVIEETFKFLPLALYIYKKRYFNEHTDGVIYFALAGLGFGLPENILYTAQFGATAGFARVVLTPFFHAATTATIGYYLAKSKVELRRVYFVIIPILLMIAVHALYDFGLSSKINFMVFVSMGLTFTLSGLLFVLFTRANESDQDSGLSSVGHNSFCRSCGQPNPKHHLYCVHCGKNA